MRADRCILAVILHRLSYLTDDERQDLADDIAVSILEDAFVVDGEALLQHSAGVLELLLKRQIADQSHLVAHHRYVVVCLNQGVRQSLLKERKLINIACVALTAEVHRSGECTDSIR